MEDGQSLKDENAKKRGTGKLPLQKILGEADIIILSACVEKGLEEEKGDTEKKKRSNFKGLEKKSRTTLSILSWGEVRKCRQTLN